MTDSDSDPIKTIEDGVMWYVPGAVSVDDQETYNSLKTKYEGEIEIYPGWVKLGRVQGTWVPREDVEQIMEE